MFGHHLPELRQLFQQVATPTKGWAISSSVMPMA
jgi:hypothetical protein